MSDVLQGILPLNLHFPAACSGHHKFWLNKPSDSRGAL